MFRLMSRLPDNVLQVVVMVSFLYTCVYILNVKWAYSIVPVNVHVLYVCN
jgi:hypothetical protein